MSLEFMDNVNRTMASHNETLLKMLGMITSANDQIASLHRLVIEQSKTMSVMAERIDVASQRIDVVNQRIDLKDSNAGT